MGRTRLFFGASLALVAIVAGAFLWRASALRELKEKGLELAKKGDFQQAEPMLKDAVARSPSDVEILRALANGYLKGDRKAQADETLTRWLALAPNEPEPLLLRIELYRKLGQFDKALLDADRLLEIDAANRAWRRKRAAILYSASRFAEAEKEFERCLQKAPNDRGLLGSLAETKRAQGKLAEAGAILDAILRDAPNDTAALMDRALIYYYQDQSEKSIPLFRTVLERDPKRERSGKYHLSLALSRVGQTEEASRLLEEVRRMQDAEVLREDSAGQPENLPLQMRNARAQFEIEKGKFPQTVQILQQVLKVDADYPPAHALMADVLEKQGRFGEAAEHRRRAKGKS